MSQTHTAETAGERPELDAASARRAASALYTIVLISGAVLMGVEIAGAKVLAPSFGTSTFVWGSIIGMFMAALASGYYLGGIVADRKPSFAVLSGVVTAAGLWTAVVIPRFGPAICEGIGKVDLGPVVGPLLATFAVFYVPSFLMGMVSPYAVKLNASSLAGLGGVTGKLYALSTFGSIVGTLLTTFVLIPSFCLSNVLTFIGLLLMAAAIVSFLLFRSATGGKLIPQERTAVAAMILLALVCGEGWAVFPVEPFVASGERLLHYEDSTYHEILITETVVVPSRDRSSWTLLPPKMWNAENAGVRRMLKFNENLESGIFPYNKEYLNAVSYTDLLHVPLLWVDKPERILVVGGGGGIIPVQYHEWYGSKVDIAEIDPAVERVARRYFQIPETPDIRFFIGDGRQTVRNVPDKTYDVIFLDAYSSGGQIPFHLLTWEFLNTVKSKLKDRGILITNIISGLRNVTPQNIPPADLFLAEYKTLIASRADALRDKTADASPMFKQVYVFPKVYEGRELGGNNLEEYRNVIVVATREDTHRTIDQLSEQMKALTSGDTPRVRAQDMNWHVDHMYRIGPNPEELAGVPILSDDYAPVDMMYRPVKRDESTRPISPW